MRTFTRLGTLLCGLALLTTAACGGSGDDTASDPAESPGSPGSSGSSGSSGQPLARVSAEVTGTSEGVGLQALESTGEAAALWLAEEGVLVYVSELGYSACAPKASVRGDATALSITLTPYDGPDMCASIATNYAVVVDGLDAPPASVEVTDLSGTSQVVVGQE